MISSLGIFVVIMIFIAVLFILELVFFELGRSRALKEKNYAWFSILNRPYTYKRTRSVIFVCAICFGLTSGYKLFTVNWFLNLLVFIAVGVIADAVVLYLIHQYGKIRCKKETALNREMQSELNRLKEDLITEDRNYEVSMPQFDSIAISKKYLKPSDHLAIMSIDQGEFVRQYGDYPALTYDVEPYSDSDAVQRKLADLPVKVTKLTKDNKMPFKDQRIDLLHVEYSNYDKYEITRVLKPGGIFIVHQAGSDHLQEFLRIYLPFGMKRQWNEDVCAASLEELDYEILEKYHDTGTIRFRNLRQIQTYFKTVSPDVAANIDLYETFFMNALIHIKEDGYYQMTTNHFLVSSRKRGM